MRFGTRSLLPALAISALLACVLAGTLAGLLAGHRSRSDPPPGQPVDIAALPGAAADDLPVFFQVFHASCVRRAQAANPLGRVCREATGPGAPRDEPEIRAFLARNFTPRRLEPAFFTGYYEPVVAASLTPTPRFATPLLARPAEVVDVRPGATPGLDASLSAARRLPDGRLVALPDRAAIERGALGSMAPPLAFVESPLDAFFVQVQGSARLKLPDGSLRRLVYAGRNGYPYTAIGRSLVTRLDIPAAQMGMAQLKAWIRDHGQGDGEEGRRLMHENRSFIFFRFDDRLPPEAGPIGADGLSLTPLRSLAVDRAVYPYGLPFYIDTAAADGTSLRRFAVGQDTGAAIKGPARADIFFGTGDGAAAQAGAQRSSGALFVLWPREAPAS